MQSEQGTWTLHAPEGPGRAQRGLEPARAVSASKAELILLQAYVLLSDAFSVLDAASFSFFAPLLLPLLLLPLAIRASLSFLSRCCTLCTSHAWSQNFNCNARKLAWLALLHTVLCCCCCLIISKQQMLSISVCQKQDQLDNQANNNQSTAFNSGCHDTWTHQTL